MTDQMSYRRVLLIFTIIWFVHTGLVSAELPVRSNPSGNDSIIPDENSYLPSLYSRYDSLVIPDSLDGSISLQHRFILQNSLRLSTLQGDSLSSRLHYRLDQRDWKLYVLTEFRADSLILSYSYLPITLRDEYYHLDPSSVPRYSDVVSEEATFSESGQRSYRGSPGSRFDGLQSRGFISRGIQVGMNQGLSVESGLRLNLSGTVGKDVKINAVLDDSNLPVAQPGASRRLEELDKVYLEFETGEAKGRFGDYTLSLHGGQYGTFNRKLQGGRFSYQSGQTEVMVAGAVSRSRFQVNRFQGIDGNQGPYILSGQRGETGFAVEGGSEKVWVDGIQRNRGRSNDYLIDYSRGEITFTPNLAITSESRIEVEFQYSPENYPKNTYASEIRRKDIKGRYDLTVSFFQEGDDYKRPFSFDLKGSDRNAFAEQGDHEGSLLIPAADSLGIGEGDYSRKDTSWTDGEEYSVFVFIPPETDGERRGEWSVLFSSVGTGNGDYIRLYDAITDAYYYEWVGPSQGNWAPVRNVDAPSRHRQGALMLHLKPVDFVDFSMELTGSDLDRNLLSSKDDGDNKGLAQKYKSTIVPLRGRKNRPVLSLSTNYRRVSKHFRSVFRDKDVDFERKWGVNEDSLKGTGNEQELTTELTFSPFLNWSLRSAYGRRSFGRDERSDRFRIDNEYSGSKLNQSTQYERIVSENTFSRSDWKRGKAQIAYRFGHWTPGIKTEIEERDYQLASHSFLGHRYYLVRGSIAGSGWQGSQGELFMELRDRAQQKDDHRFSDLYREDALGVVWRFLPAREPFRGNIRYENRRKKYSSADSSSIKTDLASMHLTWMPFRGAFKGDLTYEVNRTSRQSETLVAYRVPQGEGEYIKVDGEYQLDPEIGDYILRREPAGDFKPTTEVNVLLNLDWYPVKLPGGAGRRQGFGWEDLSTVTQFELHEITSWDKTGEVLLLNPHALLSDSTVDGRLIFRQDLHLFRGNQQGSARVRYESRRRIVNYFYTGLESDGQDSWGVRLRNKLTESIDLENNFTYTDKYRKLDDGRTNRAYRFYRSRHSLLTRWSRNWSSGLIFRFLYDRDIELRNDVRSIGIKTEIRYHMENRLRITGETDALLVITPLSELPYDMAEGRPPGRNGRITLRFDYQTGDHLSLGGSYSSRFDQGKKPIHIARMEARAFF